MTDATSHTASMSPEEQARECRQTANRLQEALEQADRHVEALRDQRNRAYRLLEPLRALTAENEALRDRVHELETDLVEARTPKGQAVPVRKPRARTA